MVRSILHIFNAVNRATSYGTQYTLYIYAQSRPTAPRVIPVGIGTIFHYNAMSIGVTREQAVHPQTDSQSWLAPAYLCDNGAARVRKLMCLERATTVVRNMCIEARQFSAAPLNISDAGVTPPVTHGKEARR